ncbi:class I SAM-dependent methyltransferase [Streptomyces cucumeris]|uniref:class I SAM-dependent methyltransferase n=1 Tax=Streptomyces cucumeris TaxID=2962890 RepID=UPI003D72A6F4
MTEPSYLTAVRNSYDTVADAYTERIPPPAELDPLSRAMLTAFAELVGTAGLGPVADLGCGPGKVTAHLAALGVPAFGIDLSPRMVEVARAAHPDLRFTVGSMTALELEDDHLGGVLAYYSTHHTPPELLPTIYAEFHRVLVPGGRLMLCGYVGDHEILRPTKAYGDHPVSFESHLVPHHHLADLLERAGFALTAQLTQAPGEGARRTVASFLARKPKRRDPERRDYERRD